MYNYETQRFVTGATRDAPVLFRCEIYGGGSQTTSFSLTCSLSFVLFCPLINRSIFTVIQSQVLEESNPWFAARCLTLVNNSEVSPSMPQRHVLSTLTDVAVAVAVAVDGVLPSALLPRCPSPDVCSELD